MKKHLNKILSILPIIFILYLYVSAGFCDYRGFMYIKSIERRLIPHQEKIEEHIINDQNIDINNINSALSKYKFEDYKIFLTRSYSFIIQSSNRNVLVVYISKIENKQDSSQNTIKWNCYGIPFVDMTTDECRRGLSRARAKKLESFLL